MLTLLVLSSGDEWQATMREVHFKITLYIAGARNSVKMCYTPLVSTLPLNLRVTQTDGILPNFFNDLNDSQAIVWSLKPTRLAPLHPEVTILNNDCLSNF